MFSLSLGSSQIKIVQKFLNKDGIGISDCRAEVFVICKHPATCIVNLMPLLTQEVAFCVSCFFSELFLLNEMRRNGSHMLYHSIFYFFKSLFKYLKKLEISVQPLKKKCYFLHKLSAFRRLYLLSIFLELFIIKLENLLLFEVALGFYLFYQYL